MADNETIADIIAEMRGMGNYQRYSGDHARVLANRLEAALKRERGDCAKLREALEHLLHGEYRDRCEVTNIAHSALSAPPRNCDKHANYIDAMNAFEAFVREQGKLGFINPYTEAFKWLFAPATEKEGGAK